MSDYWLVSIGVASKQKYIFNSNRLRENVGASELIALTTGDWAYEAVKKAVGEGHHTIEKNNDGNYTPGDGKIESEAHILAEVLYSGGGNFFVLFKEEKLSKNFARNLSQQVIRQAPGLHLTLYQTKYVWKEKTLGKEVKDAKDMLGQERSKYPPETPLAGLGVTAVCNSTSMPATWLDVDPDNTIQLYSAQTMALREHGFEEANKRLKQTLELGGNEEKLRRLLGYNPSYDYPYPFDLDELGRSENDQSFYAVVHIDGNGVGAKFNELSNDLSNRDYIRKIRKLSKDVNDIGMLALNETIRFLIECIDEYDGKPYVFDGNGEPQFELSHRRDKSFYVLPFRPILYGGDDVTFVCDGRIGITLAVQFMESLKRQPNGGLTSAAGVAIIASHYPFARAYELAEELIGNAKTLLHNQYLHGEDLAKTHSAIDWHFTTGGLYGDINDEIRPREYELTKHKDTFRKLTLRPILLENYGESMRTWEFVKNKVLHFQDKWQESRNKAKELMTALRGGRPETSRFTRRYLNKNDGPILPDIDGKQTAWKRITENTADGPDKVDYCLVYDALELMDLYIPLVTQEKVNDG